ncbi:hypothetical protein B0A55_09332 [Friedmanniomyces simplex]|uniref:Wings apart-like protein C-terminal domain-containing protein n=1 Tax=Friedmanniomyces simplex TaxID=329884 RepID=A0A4U0X1A2_9PEZI|nr:hypothetical protein B0A55_09332 [Friedmanniomyces simplex]
MATVSAAPVQRPKKLVRYGKATSRTTWSTANASQWLEDDDDDTTTSKQAPTRTSTVKESYTIQKAGSTKREEKPEVKKRVVTKQVSKPAKPKPKAEDLFDVPSSEDEARSEFVLTHVSPPRGIAKRALVDDTASKSAELASWEKAKVGPISKPQRAGNARLEDLPKVDAEQGTAPIGGGRKVSPRNAPKIPPAQEEAAAVSQTAKNNGQPTSAAARLAARRQQAGSTQATTSDATKPKPASNKRAGTAVDAAVAAPRKRSRKSPPSENDPQHVDVSSRAVCEMPPPSVEPTTMESDVYAFPDDPAEHAASKPASATDKVKVTRIRRTQTSSSPTLKPKKGVSAPARLSEMLPPDTDSTDSPSRSPSILRSRPSTPRRSATPAVNAPPSTPPALVGSSPQTAVKAAGTLTPRQAQLWSQLLASDPPAHTPSSLAIKELTLSGQKRTSGAARSHPRTLFQSSSDVTGMDRRRTRLVDRLKASMPSLDGDSSVEDSDEEMEDMVTHTKIPLKGVTKPDEADDSADRSLQSQSQSHSAVAEAGPTITYARTRTYLPEDNFEDGLMFDLPSVTPLRPPVLSREPSKSNMDSQKSAFDLDESEGEGVPGRMRTIHELRAAGRNNRFMQETEGLLEDIADHAASARSRRRGALVELATKLMDKSHVARFIGQGFEHMLVAEVAAGQEDPIADFVLAAAFAFLLVAEPAEHSVVLLKSGGVVAWLAAKLGYDVEVGKLAKDRKSNMSKAAQGTLLDFAKSVQTQTSLWSDFGTSQLTPRLVALRTLDLLVGRLRRLGDKGELLDAAQLDLVLPLTAAKATPASADLSIAISLLEALSSSAQILAWPINLLERLAILLPTLSETADIPTHTVFLALRLTLNITNDNARNCDLFARAETVHYLLSLIQSGFAALDAFASTPDKPVSTSDDNDQHVALSYDLLVLALGSTINLFEHSARARSYALPTTSSTTPPPASTTTTLILDSLLITLIQAQSRIATATSLAESSQNVAFGYLAVALANLCQDPSAREYVAGKLPGVAVGSGGDGDGGKNSGGLGLLVAAVEEFVRHHQCVDFQLEAFGGEEGAGVWGGFTEKLRGVLGRLVEVA